MFKNISVFFLFILMAGCTSNYYLSDKKELNESDKEHRHKELEQAIAKIKTDDVVTIMFYNGDTSEGAFYSYVDGILSLRTEDSFRDYELTDIRGIAFKPKDRVKKIMMVLMFVAIAGIAAQFAATH